MAQSVEDVIVSWWATRVQPERVLNNAGTPAISRRANYLAAFPAATLGAQWCQPWIGDKTYSHHWAAVLGPGYRRATPDKGWKRQVPLRNSRVPALVAASPSTTIKCHQYLFPTGVGVHVVAEIGAGMTEADLLGEVSTLGSAAVISVAGAAAQPLSAVVGNMLDAVETAVLGQTDPNSVGSLAPETLATVTATTNWPQAAIAQDDPVHRMLTGLCLLSTAPLTGVVGLLADELVHEANSHPGTARLAVGKGRVVWSPGKSATPEGADNLRCYHQNLSMVMIQTDVLLSTVNWAASLPNALITSQVKDVLRPVVNILGMLYGKAPDIYTSALVRRQIDESNLVPQINAFRATLGVGGVLH